MFKDLLSRLRRQESSHHRTRTILLKAAAMSVVAVVGLGVWAEAREQAEVRSIQGKSEQVMDRLREWPVIDLVLAEYPGVHVSLANSIKEDLLSGKEVFDRNSDTYDVLWHLRNDYIFPALRAAGDQEILDVWRTHSQALQHVAGFNTQSCVEFLDLGITLTSDVSHQLHAYKEAVANAYKDGMERAQSKELLGMETILEVWENSMNFQERHWDTLASRLDAETSIVCNTGIRMATNLHLVPIDLRVDYARTMVGSRNL